MKKATRSEEQSRPRKADHSMGAKHQNTFEMIKRFSHLLFKTEDGERGVLPFQTEKPIDGDLLLGGCCND